MLLFVYTPLSTQTLMIWKCETIGNRPYLVADFQLSCDTARHWGFSIWAGISTALYLAGIPYLFLVLVYRQRTRNVESYLSKLFHASELEDDATLRKGVAQQVSFKLRQVGVVLSDVLGSMTDRCLLEEGRVPDLLVSCARFGCIFQLTRTTGDVWHTSRCCSCCGDRERSAAAGGDRGLRHSPPPTGRECSRNRTTSALSRITRLMVMDQIRGFLYRDNLESRHGREILGFLYAAYLPEYGGRGVCF